MSGLPVARIAATNVVPELSGQDKGGLLRGSALLRAAGGYSGLKGARPLAPGGVRFAHGISGFL